jgi:hypothetical protein
VHHDADACPMILRATSASLSCWAWRVCPIAKAWRTVPPCVGSPRRRRGYAASTRSARRCCVHRRAARRPLKVNALADRGQGVPGASGVLWQCRPPAESSHLSARPSRTLVLRARRRGDVRR